MSFTKLYSTILLCLLLGLEISFASTYDICEECSFKSIKDAVESADKYDTLIVKAGIYPEHELVISKSITIIGESGSIIDGEEKGDIILIDADSVTISGLKIINVGSSFTQDFAAIKLRQTKHCNILNNRLDMVFFGIVLEKTKHAVIKGNYITSNAKDEFNSGNGIHLWYCQHILIDSNHIDNLRDGIYLEFVNNSKIRNNVSRNNLRYGLHFMFSNHND